MKALSIAALSVVAFGTPVLAADLGGTCCADLEERVSELEATTAKKDTRKMSLTIYGEVSTAILFQDQVTPSYQGNGDNPNEPTRIGVKGSAKFAPGWTAGYQLELGLSPYTTLQSGDPSVNMRQANWWIESKALGKVTVGLQDMANSHASQLSLGNVNVAALGSAGFGAENRTTGIKYSTPDAYGFSGVVSYSDSQETSFALRYAGEANGIRLAAIASYATTSVNSIYTGWTDYNQTTASNFAGSASIMHLATGLFADIGLGFTTAQTTYTDWAGHPLYMTTGNLNQANWHSHFGIKKNWTGLGHTTLYGEYIKHNSASTLDETTWGLNGGNSATAYGAGIVQALDAAAMDVFAAYRHADGGNASDTSGNLTPVPTSNSVLAGARIHF